MVHASVALWSVWERTSTALLTGAEAKSKMHSMGMKVKVKLDHHLFIFGGTVVFACSRGCMLNWRLTNVHNRHPGYVYTSMVARLLLYTALLQTANGPLFSSTAE